MLKNQKLALALLAGVLLQPAGAAPRDGSHDFDWDIGTWKMHIRRLEHPLSGSNIWYDMEGVTVNKKVWDGKANLATVEADGPHGHLELLALRLYNPQSHQWSVNFATSNVGQFSTPSVGEFNNGRCVFYDYEEINGRYVMVRFSIWSIDANHARSEQAFSTDGGKTWETNWINEYTRMTAGTKS